MQTLTRYVIVVATVAALLGWRGSVRAQGTGSPLFDGLTQILKDPDKQMTMTPDRTALVLMSHKAEVSFGGDGKMLLHAPGTLKRMTDISRGFDVNLGRALGHGESNDPSALATMRAFFRGKGLDFRMRPNQMGFAGQSYTAKDRPMDLWTDAGRLSVCPGGACTYRPIKRGPLGFAEANRIASGKAGRQLVPAIATVNVPVKRSHGPRAESRFAPRAQSRFNPSRGGRRLRTR